MIKEDHMDRHCRLVRYLLEETDEKESLEIEILCNKNDEWREDKISLNQTLTLIRDARDEMMEDDLCPELRLDEEQRRDVLSAIRKKETSIGGKSSKSFSIEDTFRNSKKLDFWIPMSVAAATLLIAYFGQLESGHEQSKTNEWENVGKKEKDLVPRDQVVEVKPQKEIDEFVVQEALEAEMLSGLNEEMIKRTRKDLLSLSSQNPDTTDLNSNVEKEDLSQGEILDSSHSSMPLFPSDENLTEKLQNALESPTVAHLFSPDGDSLGKILILNKREKKVRFERSDWPNKYMSFSLNPGIYEIRIRDEQDFTFVVRGEVQKDSSLLDKPNAQVPKYLFSINKSWFLAENEIRRPIVIPH